MTKEQAIMWLQQELDKDDHLIELPYNVALEIMGLLQNEQGMVKPSKQLSGGYYYCPICNNLVYTMERYCAMCGKALAWK